MIRIGALAALAAALAIGLAAAATPTEALHWSYSGHGGPRTGAR